MHIETVVIHDNKISWEFFFKFSNQIFNRFFAHGSFFFFYWYNFIIFQVVPYRFYFAVIRLKIVLKLKICKMFLRRVAVKKMKLRNVVDSQNHRKIRLQNCIGKSPFKAVVPNVSGRTDPRKNIFFGSFRRNPRSCISCCWVLLDSSNRRSESIEQIYRPARSGGR